MGILFDCCTAGSQHPLWNHIFSLLLRIFLLGFCSHIYWLLFPQDLLCRSIYPYAIIYSTANDAVQRSCVSLPPYDPEHDKYEQVFICIPAYSEGIEAFKRTVDSICDSNYPKDKLYMLFIVDGNKANCFQNLMSILEDRDYKGTVLY